MDWFKQNPKLGALVLLAVILIGGAGYFAFSASGELTRQKEDFAAKTGTVNRLRSAQPFPNEENLGLIRGEADQAAQLLADLAGKIKTGGAPFDPAQQPAEFQDKVNKEVGRLAALAKEKNTAWPEDFHLGFENYQTQLPSPAATPLLGQQFLAIAHVASVLLDAPVRSIVSLTRPPLEVEKNAEENAAAAGATSEKLSPLVLAPFDVEFVAEESQLRSVLAAIVGGEPTIFVRLVEVLNSQPAAPAKTPEGEAAQPTPADSEQAAEQIPVILGKETLKVRLRLAAISAANGEKAP